MPWRSRMAHLSSTKKTLTTLKGIVSVCCGLLIVDPETIAIRIVHFTTQEYFKPAGFQHFPHAKKDIAASCLTYLPSVLFNGLRSSWIYGILNPDPKPKESSGPKAARLTKYRLLEFLHVSRHSILKTKYIIMTKHNVKEL